MRFLLTRAADDSARLQARLEALGHTALVSPVIDIIATPATWPTGVVDALLATSGHAFLDASAAARPAPEARRLLPLLLVGARTEEAARQRGYAGRAVVEASGALLAERIGGIGRTFQRIVYLAGRDRKPDLERALRMHGTTVEAIETYEARPAETLTDSALAELKAGSIDGVLHFSRRSAALFLALAARAGVEPTTVRHLCLSEDVSVPLRQASCEVDVAEAPNEAALLAGIERLTQA